MTWQCWTGVLGFAGALALIKLLRPAAIDGVLLILALAAAPVLAFEARRALNERSFRRSPAAPRRVAFKCAGLAQTWIAIAAVYWIVPFYANGAGGLLLEFVRRPAVLLPLLVLVPAYVWLEDATSPEPEDTLYRIGRRVTGLDAELTGAELSQYLMGWAIKAFFLPIMASGAVDNVNWWLQYRIDARFFPLYEASYSLIFFLDLAFATMGYLCTFKLLGTQIRSSQPLVLGWAAALICYPPFWNGIADTIFLYNPDGRMWGAFFTGMPNLARIWAIAIFLLGAVYVSATIQFGVRFSNLTNRGILTNGPYRWCKHPAYLAKNISWWMLAVPFLPHTDALASLRACLLLAALNGIYYLRAKTEERHLSEDPDYRAYMAFMAENGLVAMLRRRLWRRHPARAA